MMGGSTKSWNTNLDNAPADGQVYVDFTDSFLENPCSTKLKIPTDDLTQWINTHRQHFKDGSVFWEDKPYSTTMKVKLKNRLKDW